ncbi:MAG: hypothetical protein O2816_07400 [Planctomycetota bacterium]|nr:hypothetical protein [Planctomycetota bacterium]
MRLTRPLSLAAACLAGANLAGAQELHFNEILASHTGTDFSEYIELIGTPNMSLDGWMVVVLDGDSFAAGILDRAWDLTGHTMPSDGYFVLDNAGSMGGDYDMAQGPHGGGASDNLENGTQTYYLLTSTDTFFVQTLHNQDLDLDDDLVTTLAQFPGTIDIKEVVGVWDEDGPQNGEQVFDGALELGPDLSGPFEPAGIFRPDDYPNCWCNDEWLDFFLAGVTPGALNPSSGCSLANCGGSGGPIGTNFCGPANLNSTGLPAVMSAFGQEAAAANDVRLDASQMSLNQFGYFINSQTQGFVNPPGSQGNLCLSGQIGRYTANVSSTGATGEFSLQLNLNSTPTPGGHVAVNAGESWYFQAWYRDVNPSPTNNFTDGICITFN